MLYSIPLGAVDQKTLSSCLAQLASQRQYCPMGRKEGRTDGRKSDSGFRLPRVLEEEEDGDDETIRGVVAVVIVTSSP